MALSFFFRDTPAETVDRLTLFVIQLGLRNDLHLCSSSPALDSCSFPVADQGSLWGDPEGASVVDSSCGVHPVVLQQLHVLRLQQELLAQIEGFPQEQQRFDLLMPFDGAHFAHGLVFFIFGASVADAPSLGSLSAMQGSVTGGSSRAHGGTRQQRQQMALHQQWMQAQMREVLAHGGRTDALLEELRMQGIGTGRAEIPRKAGRRLSVSSVELAAECIGKRLLLLLCQQQYSGNLSGSLAELGPTGEKADAGGGGGGGSVFPGGTTTAITPGSASSSAMGNPAGLGGGSCAGGNFSAGVEGGRAPCERGDRGMSSACAGFEVGGSGVRQLLSEAPGWCNGPRALICVVKPQGYAEETSLPPLLASSAHELRMRLLRLGLRVSKGAPRASLADWHAAVGGRVQVVNTRVAS